MQEFLSAILAGEGQYCIVGLKKGDARPAIQSFTPNLGDTQKAIDTFVAERRDVYFALATFKDPNVAKPRGQENVHQIKSLWIDLDCSEEKAAEKKGYIDKEAAIEALAAFLEDTQLPDPIIVDSGGGIHAYWPFSKALSREDWQPLADGLEELCKSKGLYLDDSCTADAARVLRVPGTYNFKQADPRPVKLLAIIESPYDSDALSELIPKPEKRTFRLTGAKREPSELTKALMGNKTSYFKKIMQKSKAGTGCQQLWRIYTEQETVDYASWRCGLSVANACMDREDAIHKISRKHPDYDPDETERKADDTAGPFYCDTFEKANPGGCEGCPHKGKISTPIMLGTEIEESKATEVVVKQPDNTEVSYDIPKLPDPYFRGKYGGIYRTAKDNDQILVYPHDLFIVQRIHDAEEGDSAWMRLHLPKDGVRNFTVAMATLSGLDTMRSELAKRGVITPDWKELQYYILKVASELQMQKKAEVAHHQFGWTKRGSFVVGDIEQEGNKKRYVPPTVTTSDMVGWYHQKGTLEGWKSVYNTYAMEGLENRAFAALTGFGAPLLKIASAHKGVLLHLIHKESGTGKSTILRMINSIWGHPEEPMRNPEDTKASLVLRMGVLNNLPLTVDELTNIKPEELSNFLYGVTQGRGRDRMNANANTLRANKQTWQTVGVTNGNSSHYDKLHTLKDLPKGEIFRCVEYEVGFTDLISTEAGIRIFDEELMENYGHAWSPYMAAVQNNKQAAIDKVKEYVAMFNDKLVLSSSYRFYSTLGAINLAGGHIAKELGLIDYNLTRIYEFYSDVISSLKEVNQATGNDPNAFISHFILKYMAQNTLVIDDACDARTGAISQQAPRGELVIRMEPDTKKIFITKKKLQAECVEGGVMYKSMVKDLEKNGFLVSVGKKGMSKGTLVCSPPVDVVVLDAEKMGIEIPTTDSLNVVGQD